MAVTCPACAELLTSSEAEKGRCPCCQTVLPPSLKDSATSRFDREADPGDGSIWTTPVDPDQWPPVRWWVQSVAGLFLVLLMAPCLTIIPFSSKTIVERVFHVLLFGLPLGLCLAGTLNGLIVARRTRRLTFASVAALEFATLIYGFMIFGLATLSAADAVAS